MAHGAGGAGGRRPGLSQMMYPGMSPGGAGPSPVMYSPNQAAGGRHNMGIPGASPLAGGGGGSNHGYYLYAHYLGWYRRSRRGSLHTRYPI
jgi:hypothetical protein